MTFDEMKSFLVWGAVFLILAISTAYQHRAWDVIAHCLLVATIGIWMARVAWRKENPRR